MIEYHTAIQPHLAPMFHLHHHSADLQLNTLKRSTELGEASHRSISSGTAGRLRSGAFVSSHFRPVKDLKKPIFIKF